MKKGKGHILRPCLHCSRIVRYVLWEGKLGSSGQVIYHWQNEDGSHHVCDPNGKPFLKPKTQEVFVIANQSDVITTYPNHSYPLYSDPDVPPWDESLGEFSYS